MPLPSITNCKEMTRLISEAMDQPLSPRQKIQLKIHLLICPGCAHFQRHLNGLRDLMSRCGRSQKQPPIHYVGSLSAEKRNHIKSLLRMKNR